MTSKSQSKKTIGKTRLHEDVSLNSGLTKKDYLKLYYFMRLMREFEDNILRLYNQGKIVGGAYSGERE